jgi:predicted phosphoribosyltransferase
MRKKAYLLGREMIWSHVAHLYMESFQRARRSRLDLLVCPNLRGGLSFAVADAYENWYDVEQDEVLELLACLPPPQA